MIKNYYMWKPEGNINGSLKELSICLPWEDLISQALSSVQQRIFWNPKTEWDIIIRLITSVFDYSALQVNRGYSSTGGAIHVQKY